MIAIAIEACALDVLHDEVGTTLLGFPRVDEPGDVGVIEIGEDLPLGTKAQAESGMHGGAFDHFDGNGGAVLRVSALAEIDVPHTAVTEHRGESISADLLTEQGTAVIVRGVTGLLANGVGQRACNCAQVAGDETEYFLCKPSILRALPGEEAFALLGRQLECAREELLNAKPTGLRCTVWYGQHLSLSERVVNGTVAGGKVKWPGARCQ